MAKKQNDKDFMSSQDFLGDLFKNVGKSTGASLFEKLSTNARQEAIQPLVKSLQTQALTKPLIDLKNKADKAQKAGMAAYIAANPEIDESLLYDGTGDLVNSIMQQNNLRFRQINQQLSFMDIRNPRYQELANELNKINTTSAQLREDNKKLLGIRNLMKDDNAVERLSDGMTDAEKALYNDILIGNRQNFVNINGKLHWQNPDNANEDPVAISSIDAAGPVYANSVVMEKHIGLYNEVINAQFVDDRILHNKINNLWNMEGVGNAGLKSFIFDNEGAEDILGFDTSEWFETWFKDNNIISEEAQEAERQRIKNAGVLADGSTGNVKQHFSAWYHSKLKSSVASQYNKIQAAKKTDDGVLNPRVGCTDPKATNYKSDATIDDGSCVYGTENTKQQVYDKLFDYDNQMNDKSVATQLNRNREVIGMPESVKADATSFDFKEAIELVGLEDLVIGIDEKYTKIPINNYIRRDGKFIGQAGIALDNIFSVYNTMIESGVEMTGENFDKLYTQTYGQL